MSSIRSEAIAAITRSAESIDPVDQVFLAVTHNIPEWFVTAYSALCTREKPITWAEGERLGARTIAFIAEAREKLRNDKLNSLGARAKFDARDVESTLMKMRWPGGPAVAALIVGETAVDDVSLRPPSPPLVTEAEPRLSSPTPVAPAASEETILRPPSPPLGTKSEPQLSSAVPVTPAASEEETNLRPLPLVTETEPQLSSPVPVALTASEEETKLRPPSPPHVTETEPQVSSPVPIALAANKEETNLRHPSLPAKPRPSVEPGSTSRWGVLFSTINLSGGGSKVAEPRTTESKKQI